MWVSNGKDPAGTGRSKGIWKENNNVLYCQINCHHDTFLRYHFLFPGIFKTLFYHEFCGNKLCSLSGKVEKRKPYYFGHFLRSISKTRYSGRWFSFFLFLLCFLCSFIYIVKNWWKQILCTSLTKGTHFWNNVQFHKYAPRICWWTLLKSICSDTSLETDVRFSVCRTLRASSGSCIRWWSANNTRYSCDPSFSLSAPRFGFPVVDALEGLKIQW